MNATDSKNIKLGSTLTLDKAAALSAELKTALESEKSLSLDVSEVEDIDLSCLQVLLSARRWAKNTGKSLTLNGLPRDSVVSRLQICGFLKTTGKIASLEAALLDF